MTKLELSQRESETTEQYLQRLSEIPTSELSDHQQHCLALVMSAARRKLATAEHEATEKEAASQYSQRIARVESRDTVQNESQVQIEEPLARIKREIQSLKAEDRQQLILWVAHGMPKD
jgi:hypothetical protein